MTSGKKIEKEFIIKYLTLVGLAYWVLYFPIKDAITLRILLIMPPSMEYKLGKS